MRNPSPPLLLSANRRARAISRSRSDSDIIYGLGAWVLLGAVVLLLSACAQTQPKQGPYNSARDATPQGSAFNKQLHEEYFRLSTVERMEYDWQDSTHFAVKALAAADDEQVGPDSLRKRSLPGGTVTDLSDARQQLVSALARGAAAKAPVQAAKAQSSFDCWLQEQEENHQPEDIAACRKAFELAMVGVNSAIGSDYTVYFQFDSVSLTEAGRKTLNELIEAARTNKGARIELTGHADRAGGDAYNLSLSKQRVDAISRLLSSAGLKAEQINLSQHGESRPAVDTADGTAEAKNRRVDITLVK